MKKSQLFASLSVYLCVNMAVFAQNCWNNMPPTLSSDKSTICVGRHAELRAENGTYYTWSTGETTASIRVSPQTRQTYFVSVYDAKGCLEVLEKTIAVSTLHLKPMQNVQITAGNSATVGFNAPQLTFGWNNGAKTPQITVTPRVSTAYMVTATTLGGCSAVAKVAVEVLIAPEKTLSDLENQSINQPLSAKTLSDDGTTTTVRNAFSVFPNPLGNADATLKVVAQHDDNNATIVVTDIWGRVVYTQHADVFTGTNYIRLAIASLDPATYIVRIISNVVHFEAQKIIKNN